MNAVATIGESIDSEMMEKLNALEESLTSPNEDYALPQVSDRTDEPVLAGVRAEKTAKPTLTMRMLQIDADSLREQIKELQNVVAEIKMVNTDLVDRLTALENKPTVAVPAYKQAPTVIEGLTVFGNPNRRAQDNRGKWVSLNAVGHSCEEYGAYNRLVKSGKTHDEALALIHDEFGYSGE